MLVPVTNWFHCGQIFELTHRCAMWGYYCIRHWQHLTRKCSTELLHHCWSSSPFKIIQSLLTSTRQCPQTPINTRPVIASHTHCTVHTRRSSTVNSSTEIWHFQFRICLPVLLTCSTKSNPRSAAQSPGNNIQISSFLKAIQSQKIRSPSVGVPPHSTASIRVGLTLKRGSVAQRLISSSWSFLWCDDSRETLWQNICIGRTTGWYHSVGIQFLSSISTSSASADMQNFSTSSLLAQLRALASEPWPGHTTPTIAVSSRCLMFREFVLVWQ